MERTDITTQKEKKSSFTESWKHKSMFDGKISVEEEYPSQSKMKWTNGTKGKIKYQHSRYHWCKMITNPNEATFNDNRMLPEKQVLLMTTKYFHSKKDSLPIEENESTNWKKEIVQKLWNEYINIPVILLKQWIDNTNRIFGSNKPKFNNRKITKYFKIITHLIIIT